MRAFRLCRSSYPAYDGEGARRVGGRWNSKGVRVLYMSENRSLAVLEVLVHLSGTLPDKYLLGAADIPEDVAVERIADKLRLRRCRIKQVCDSSVPRREYAARELDCS